MLEAADRFLAQEDKIPDEAERKRYAEETKAFIAGLWGQT
jgi:hypothetical protein